MAIRAGRLTNPASRAAAGLALTVLLVMTVAAVITQTAFRDADERADRVQAEADARAIESAMRVLVARADQLAAAAASGEAAFALAARPIVDDDDARAALIIEANGNIAALVSTNTVAPLHEGGTIAGSTALERLVADTTATAKTQLAAPIELTRGEAIVAAAPVIPPATLPNAAARRAAATFAVVVVAPFRDLQAAAATASPVRLRTSTGPIGQPVRDPILRTSVRAGDEAWTAELGRPPGGPTRSGWVVFGAGILAATATYVVIRRQRQGQAVAEAAAAERASHLEVIAATSAALQQSLDLAELLPSFCVEIAEQFHRTSVAVHIAEDDGRLVETFRYGTPTEMDASLEIDLRRGWRVVGRLVVRGVVALDDVATQSLQALSDLLAVAITNAALYQREQQAVARLSELDALKNAFLGTVSHELRTSTTAVQGFGDLLTEHWDALSEDRRRELAGRIRRQAGSLRHLVDDLLDYARLEHDSLRVAPRMMELSELVRQLAESMAPLTPTHQLVLEIEEDVDAYVDPVAVERILANLLSNAGKYAPPGSKVTVGVESVGDRARLRVADEGPGIPLDERRRVFVRFYRLSNAETIRTRGAGIGLSILSDFAERSGAIVTIDDAPGGGALLMVDFPTEAADVPAEASA